MDRIEVAMKEYESLRTEIGMAFSNQQSVLSYGIASLSVILAFTTATWGQTIIVDAVLLLVVPAVAFLVLAIWIGEVNRISRAGRFL